MEETDIVEFYPRYIDPSNLKDEGYDQRKTYHFKVTGQLFSRTVYRPIEGPDIFMQQSKGEVIYEHACDLKRDCFIYPQRFTQNVLAREPVTSNPMLLHYRILHQQNWNWHNVANDLTDNLVEGHKRKLKPFAMTGCEAFGKLKVINGPVPWHLGYWHEDERFDGVVPCSICYEEVNGPHENLIALKCNHIFHRKCYFPGIWKSEDIKCPSCLYLTFF